jgi:phosphoadenosine phosphosulfate reductase
MSNKLASLNDKIAKSLDICKEALETYGGKIAVAWTGGKDSTTTLHLLKELGGGKVNMPVLNIDTSVKFKEIYEFRDRLAREWELDLYIERNEEAIKTIKISDSKEECCLKLKAQVISDALRKYNWNALITGVRWDEQADRINEVYFSPRTDPDHVRIHPILHFTEMDIWTYIRKYNVPFCDLYRQGYRSLGCEPCTRRGVGAGTERGQRDHQKEEIMHRLRKLGYF